MQLKTASAIIIIGNLAWTASAQLRAHTRHTRELGTDCSQNNRALVSKYGRQLCPDEIQDKFTSRSEFPASSGFLGMDPSFKDFVVNSKEYNSLTWEEVQSVCVTKCDKSPNCDLVSIEPKDGDKYSCITYKPSERPGGYMVDAPESLGIITYTKRSAEELYPPFVPCDIRVSKIQTGIACIPSDTSFLEENAEDCSEIMTSDFFEYIVPAVFCLATVGGPAKVGGCLSCMLTKGTDELLELCATDNSSLIRHTCKSECYDGVKQCEVPLQNANICVAGSHAENAGDGRFYGGAITKTNGDYTCPADVFNAMMEWNSVK